MNRSIKSTSACISLMLMISAICTTAHAQDDTPLNPELIHLHTDKPFYLAGETMWYRTYFLNEDKSTIRSKVLYVDMIDQSGNVVFDQKVKINKDGFTSGSVELPFDLKESYYLLRCYTKWNLNFPVEAIFSKKIAVYNEWENPVSANSFSDNKVDTLDVSINNNGSLKVQVEKTSGGGAGETSIAVLVTDQNGQPVSANLSASVVDATVVSPASTHDIATTQTGYQRIKDLQAEGIRDFEHEENLVIAGLLYEPETGEKVTSDLLMGNFIRNGWFRSSEADEAEFQIFMPDFYGTEKIQVHNLNPYGAPAPTLEINRFADRLPKLSDGQKPPRTDEIKKYIYLSSIRRKFNEIFRPEEENEAGNSQDNGIEAKAATPDKFYDANKYKNLKNIEEFIDEVIVSAHVLKKNVDGRSVRIFSPDISRRYSYRPWYMVNGYFIPEESAALAIPMKEVKSVSVFNRRESIEKHFHLNFALRGIISIEVKENFLPFILEEIQGLIDFKGFEQPQSFEEYRSAKFIDGNQPNFEPLIYWSPAVQTDQNGRATFTFKHNNTVGNFMIYVEGLSTGGESGNGHMVYEIELQP
ncbi:MAG: hypothetical protein AAFX87_00245 [Bacteroidota bacterium]